MKQFSFSDEKKKAIIDCLSWLEDNTTATPSGFTIEFTPLFHFAEEIFLELIALGEEYPERTKRAILSASIMRWLKYNKTINNQNFELFLRAVKTELKHVNQQKSIYSVLMFLNIGDFSIFGCDDIEILGSKLQVLSWHEASNIYSQDLLKEIHFYKRDNPIILKLEENCDPSPNYLDFTPIVIRVDAYDSGSALDIAADRLDLFRFILNIPSVLSRYIYTRSEPGPLSKVLPSPIYVVCNKERGIEKLFFSSEKYQYTKQRILPDEKEFIQFFLAKLKTTPSPKSTWAFILNILRLYQKALDTVAVDASYLTMWQVFEISLSLGEQQLQNRDLRSRYECFLSLNAMDKTMINILFERRNRYVHSGRFLEVGDHSLFILKLFTDRIIRRLVSLAEQYPTLPEIREFVELSSKGDGDLERKKDVIEKIIEKRRDKQ
jgi:hypothetical protein